MASIEHRGGKSYRASFYHKGNRATKVFEAKDEKDAKLKAAVMEVRFRETGSVDGETKADKEGLLVADLAQEYMNIKTRGDDPIKEKTRQKYQDLLDNYILPYWKGRIANSITPFEVEKFKQFLCTPEARVNKNKKEPFAKSTISEIYKLFAYMMNKAEIWEFIDKNPCRKIEMPKVPKREKIYYRPEEITELLSLIKRDTQLELARTELMKEQTNFKPFTVQKKIITALKNQLVINIAIKTGSRRGAIAALRRGDINLTDKYITFSRQVVYTPGKGTYLEEGLKTQDKNTVFINDSLVEMIERYYVELDKLFELSDGKIPKTDLLFMKMSDTQKYKAGDLLNPDNISSEFKRYIKRKGLREIPFHKLRSTNITYLANSGVDLVTVSELAGHSDTSVTKDYYVASYDSSKVDAANKFNTIDEMVKNYGKEDNSSGLLEERL
ncbi:site-specific integrase [Proteiniborus sp. MB09-C3]|uniref:tyrosine-type recombinase/integrase n=1 Tax=Proteiniborus sp. MB09-C3 TaxID=3050072 RepID=UPI002556257F|nr:site-specific integrase [Proteiniborus sp. MB09-C3]WIV13226.1 tyrosine-type recombinase/integrase [Proteiniborus sp. MB09-C3]